MLDLLFIASIIGSGVQIAKESLQKTIPAENWANKELYYEDMMNGVPMKQLMKNVENGKYILRETHPEPHKDENGKIIIENCLLYNEDLKNHGAVQTMKWVKQGKYNLSPEELEKERERIQKKFDEQFELYRKYKK